MSVMLITTPSWLLLITIFSSNLRTQICMLNVSVSSTYNMKFCGVKAYTTLLGLSFYCYGLYARHISLFVSPLLPELWRNHAGGYRNKSCIQTPRKSWWPQSRWSSMQCHFRAQCDSNTNTCSNSCNLAWSVFVADCNGPRQYTPLQQVKQLYIIAISTFAILGFCATFRSSFLTFFTFYAPIYEYHFKSDFIVSFFSITLCFCCTPTTYQYESYDFCCLWSTDVKGGAPIYIHGSNSCLVPWPLNF